ncbi:MAG: preprotein translocase subunit SecG [Clostridiales bacterium]|nr:preprotein translocase subunit SecG [Clostridiales bacterium]
MLNVYNLLNTPVEFYEQYKVVSIILIILMAIAALTAVVLILLQPANSSGIDALGGSSETFFGKNKGKSIEEKLKKWTWICLAVLVFLSIAFYIIPLIVV